MNKELFHKILYSFTPRFIKMGDILLKKGDKTDSIFIVMHGTLEVYDYIDGNEFIIEKLNQGSVLNYRVISTNDEINTEIRAK